MYMAMHDEVVVQNKVGSKGEKGHERTQSSTQGEKNGSENSVLLRATSSTPHHAASLYTHRAGIGLLPLACGGRLRA